MNPIRNARRLIAAAALLGMPWAPAPALAQQGWWEPVAPPPPPGPVYVEPPPVIYGEPPPGWQEAPPDYYAAPLPPGEVPENLPRGRLVIGPDGAYRVEPLPGEGYDDRYAQPDPYEPYPGEPYPEEEVYRDGYGDDRYGDDRYGDEDRSRAILEGYEESPVISNRRGADPWSGDLSQPPSEYDQAPSLEGPAGPVANAPSVWRQLEVLSVYEPAKRAAVGLSDPYKRMEAVKRANAWLVSTSASPATAATIRAIDKVLDIDTTDDRTTALPGAGTTVEQPKVKAPASLNEGGLARLAAYADARSLSEDPAAAAASVLGQGNDKKALEAEEVAGLDAFFGFGDGASVVQAPPAGSERAIQ